MPGHSDTWMKSATVLVTHGLKNHEVLKLKRDLKYLIENEMTI